MTPSILVPLDGSAFGEYALPLAMTMAKRLNGAIHLVHVHSLLDATYGELQVFDNTLDLELRNKEREYLHTVQARLQDSGFGPVTIRNVDGDVASVVREQAENLQASWVVMTTHGRGPMARFWLGSVADELVRSLTMPLVLVHPQEDRVDLTKPQTIQHMLIPLDGTPLAEQILPDAIRLGKALGSDFTLLRVVAPVYPSALPTELTVFDGAATDIMNRVEHLHSDLKTEANDYLEKIAAPMRAEGIKVQTCVSIEDQPGVAILESAGSPIDMIAMETHGRGGLSRLLQGSVSDKVIRNSKLPVLVHKPGV